MQESGYYKFLCDVKGMKLEKAIECLKHDDMGQACLFHIINSFSPINNIAEDDLARYIGLTISEVQEDLKGLRHTFPERINGVIRKVRAIGF